MNDPRHGSAFEGGNSHAPTLFARVAIAGALALFSAVLSWLVTHRAGFGIPDFHWWWVGARALLDGQDPYEAAPRIIGGGIFRLYHPMPAMLITAPFALLRPDVALSLFSALSTGALAFGVTRRSYDRLPLFLSASFAHAAVMGQWSILLSAALFLPWLSFAWAAKPNVGVPLLGTSLSWRSAAAMATLTVLSLVVMPTWPREWIAQLSGTPHFSPLRTGVGAVTILALLRWRRPEARLVALLGVVPQSPYSYEVLPLFLVPQTRAQTYVLVIGSDVVMAVNALTRGMDKSMHLLLNSLTIVIAMYLPALVMVLRRPNEGRLPAWLERLSQRLPQAIRGRIPDSHPVRRSEIGDPA